MSLQAQQLSSGMIEGGYSFPDVSTSSTQSCEVHSEQKGDGTALPARHGQAISTPLDGIQQKAEEGNPVPGPAVKHTVILPLKMGGSWTLSKNASKPLSLFLNITKHLLPVCPVKMSLYFVGFCFVFSLFAC